MKKVVMEEIWGRSGGVVRVRMRVGVDHLVFPVPY